MSYLVLSYCPNVAAFQQKLAYFAKQDIEGIAKIREVVPQYTTIQDENGQDVIVEQSYKFAGLA